MTNGERYRFAMLELICKKLGITTEEIMAKAIMDVTSITPYNGEEKQWE